MMRKLPAPLLSTLLMLGLLLISASGHAAGKIEIDESRWISVGAGARAGYTAVEDAAVQTNVVQSKIARPLIPSTRLTTDPDTERRRVLKLAYRIQDPQFTAIGAVIAFGVELEGQVLVKLPVEGL